MESKGLTKHFASTWQSLFGLKSDFLCLDVAKDIVPKFLWAAEKLLLGAGQRNGGAKRKARCAVEG